MVGQVKHGRLLGDYSLHCCERLVAAGVIQSGGLPPH
jgi:hypothetical protein